MDEIFFSQLLNNLQPLPVYSLKLYSRLMTGGSNERERHWLFRFGEGERTYNKGSVKRTRKIERECTVGRERNPPPKWFSWYD